MLRLKPAEGAVALAVGVGTHIEAPVTRFLEQRFGSEDGKPKVPLVASFSEEGFVPTNKFYSVVRKIRDDVDELRKRGDVREVHFFYAGPYAIAAGIGAIVDNWVPVHVYMYNSKTRVWGLFIRGLLVRGGPTLLFGSSLAHSAVLCALGVLSGFLDQR
jgi:hypothetical protein